MEVKVSMEAFGNNGIRTVVLPKEFESEENINTILEGVFYYGQNDIQPLPFPSVSVGDVIILRGKEYRVESIGFEEIK